MNTKIIHIDADNIDMDKLKCAAEVIKAGGLVAFPTETVYGLGANALNKEAVEKIFKAKGRPSDNPLIVHIADKYALPELTKKVSENAVKAINNFWPGPITLVMEKSDAVPHIITAGLSTVAIRMPVHPIALALIRGAGLPVAAPSANTSGKPSPTSAKHVIEDLFGKVDVIIDGGSSEVGVESTVLDTIVTPPMILRPGGITAEQLEQIFGQVQVDPGLVKSDFGSVVPRSPGMKYTHYSPEAQVIVVEGGLNNVVSKINELVKKYKSQGVSVGVLATEQTKGLYKDALVISGGDRENPSTIATNLFGVLRDFDQKGAGVILAEAVDSSGIGLAVMNRMNKAAGYNIIRAEEI